MKAGVCFIIECLLILTGLLSGCNEQPKKNRNLHACNSKASSVGGIPAVKFFYQNSSGCWQLLIVENLSTIEYTKGQGGELEDGSIFDHTMARKSFEVIEREVFFEELSALSSKAVRMVDIVNRPFDSSHNLLYVNDEKVIDVYGGKSLAFNKGLQLFAKFAGIEIDFYCINM